MGHIIGIDVGGTFTDLIAINPQTNLVQLAKTPTTVDNQSTGVLRALSSAGVTLPAANLIIHGTTTTTNAVLERKLAKTGLITTAGFRDILELGRRTRPNPYGMTGTFTPIIPRDLRIEIKERMDAQGQIVEPINLASVERALKSLLAKGCEALVIHFLHSYANSAHELAALESAKSLWPNSYITAGHALLSESREFERGVTAAVNASVQPILERYIERLRHELANQGYQGELLVVNGNGGTVSAAQVAKEAAKTVMSGPASGVIAAAYTGRQAGFPNLITYDMGGTSTDVALIKHAEPAVSSEIEIEYALPIHLPMVDVRTVGAGGGSIAKVNAGGLLEVGPESAGASPGPICYGKGGTLPAISDANFLLGRLNMARIAPNSGPELQNTIQQQIEDKLGKPLKLSALEAAEAVIKLANMKMAGAIRMVSLSLGADPRDFALFAFGGAGPLHASALAKELGIPRVLIPARPGITNALGCLLADLRQDYVQTLNAPLTALNEVDIHKTFSAQKTQGDQFLDAARTEIVERVYSASLDMQFAGQSHILRVPLATLTPSLESIKQAFDQVYFDRFRIELEGVPIHLVNVNLSVTGRRPAIDLACLMDPAKRASSLAGAQIGERNVYFNGEWHSTMIYEREKLPAQLVIQGPAIIEQMDTTILIEPGDTASSDAMGNLIIETAK